MVLHAPLDLEYWLVNTLSGSWMIFGFIAVAFIAFLSAKFRMDKMTFLMILALFGVIMGQYVPVFNVFIIIFAGFFIAAALSKIINR